MSVADKAVAGHVRGTEGYADEALITQYESLAFADVHRHVLHLLPSAQARVLDVGAGTGRDAAALAALGHEVTAVEPTGFMREAAIRLHPSPRIEWVEDSLPELAALAGRERRYELVMLTAVWMHLEAEQRRQAMGRVATLLAPGGRMILSLRHGPVPPGRHMFEVSAEETIRLAATVGCTCIFEGKGKGGGLKREGVYWSSLAFSTNAP